VTLRRALVAVGLASGALTGGATRQTSAPRPVPAYAPVRDGDDTLRVRLASASARERRDRTSLGMMVVGYLSPRGLPPMQGALTVTDSGLVFRSADRHYVATLPVVGPVRESPQGRWRASAVALAYVDEALGRRFYLFRVEGGVFETDAPGALMDVAAHPAWLDSLGSREWTREHALVDAADPKQVESLLDEFLRGPYADSLYAIFGRPVRPAGIVGERGRAVGRLGEYVATRDSLALDPGSMTSMDQLRHTLAHELAHRWQSRSGAQLAALWRDVPEIRDPKRYGYHDRGEHQAEAAAFAVHFLLTTAGTADAAAETATLDHYELLVPGTRTMARYFAMQPAFARHPLRSLLTTGHAH
jgi:hypothetical protein